MDLLDSFREEIPVTREEVRIPVFSRSPDLVHHPATNRSPGLHRPVTSRSPGLCRPVTSRSPGLHHHPVISLRDDRHAGLWVPPVLARR